MVEEGLRYDVMVEGALRGVVRQALTVAAEHGLPGNHHFYVTFRTEHPEVSMPDHLRVRYPSEMTIVLQYQFWDLRVDDQGFGVTLSFHDKPERLEVPWQAVTAFADPSVRFGLQFDAAALTQGAPHEAEPEAPAAPGEAEPSAEAEPDAEASDKVVTLDTFRKK